MHPCISVRTSNNLVFLFYNKHYRVIQFYITDNFWSGLLLNQLLTDIIILSNAANKADILLTVMDEMINSKSSKTTENAW